MDTQSPVAGRELSHVDIGQTGSELSASSGIDGTHTSAEALPDSIAYEKRCVKGLAIRDCHPPEMLALHCAPNVVFWAGKEIEMTINPRTDERVKQIKEAALREARSRKDEPHDEPRDLLEQLERQLFNDDNP